MNSWLVNPATLIRVEHSRCAILLIAPYTPSARVVTISRGIGYIHQEVRQQFVAVSVGIAAGLLIRHNNVPEGTDVAEQFIQTLKEQLLWV